MKKYWILFLSAGILSLAIFLTGSAIKNDIKRVEVLSLEPQFLENTVTCSGRVERTENRNVYLQSSCMVDEVFVSEGQQVSAGDTLLTVSGLVNQKRTKSSESSEGNPKNIDNAIDFARYYNTYTSPQEAYEDYLAGNLALPSEEKEEEEYYISDGKQTDFTAPTDGIVTGISVKDNTPVSAGQVAMVISAASDLQVRLSVNESQISAIRIGQKVKITGVGFKDTVYEGTVRSISNEAKQILSAVGQETIVEVLVSVDTEGDDIKPGFTAKCEIVTSEEKNLLIVPYESVRADENGAEFVYLSEEGRAQKRYITTGTEYEVGFQVKEGLFAGESVLLTPDSVSDWDRILVVREGVVNANA